MLALQAELVAGGMRLGASSGQDPDSVWRAVGTSATEAYKNATQRRNGDVWDQVGMYNCDLNGHFNGADGVLAVCCLCADSVVTVWWRWCVGPGHAAVRR